MTNNDLAKTIMNELSARGITIDVLEKQAPNGFWNAIATKTDMKSGSLKVKWSKNKPELIDIMRQLMDQENVSLSDTRDTIEHDADSIPGLTTDTTENTTDLGVDIRDQGNVSQSDTPGDITEQSESLPSETDDTSKGLQVTPSDTKGTIESSAQGITTDTAANIAEIGDDMHQLSIVSQPDTYDTPNEPVAVSVSDTRDTKEFQPVIVERDTKSAEWITRAEVEEMIADLENRLQSRTDPEPIGADEPPLPPRTAGAARRLEGYRGDLRVKLDAALLEILSSMADQYAGNWSRMLDVIVWRALGKPKLSFELEKGEQDQLKKWSREEKSKK